ncbi:hypothetical protein GCM10010389_40740 [Streptomyces echinoruber]|uniref:Uncharacterized protein n=1 Tax=Streptomyces echinoruber TaxID=68898 RepID=A0A918VFN3_9ACTN|nr:hypothetical protein GCM10010389_40740 [Streptomyces echinoruber]
MAPLPAKQAGAAVLDRRRSGTAVAFPGAGAGAGLRLPVEPSGAQAPTAVRAKVAISTRRACRALVQETPTRKHYAKVPRKLKCELAPRVRRLPRSERFRPPRIFTLSKTVKEGGASGARPR